MEMYIDAPVHKHVCIFVYEARGVIAVYVYIGTDRTDISISEQGFYLENDTPLT